MRFTRKIAEDSVLWQIAHRVLKISAFKKNDNYFSTRIFNRTEINTNFNLAISCFILTRIHFNFHVFVHRQPSLPIDTMFYPSRIKRGHSRNVHVHTHATASLYSRFTSYEILVRFYVRWFLIQVKRFEENPLRKIFGDWFIIKQ